MEIQRKQDNSLVYWLQDLLKDSPFINIVSEYNDVELSVPCVAVETDRTMGSPYQLGDRELLLTRKYFIDIYAKNITQRNDYAYKIMNELKNPIPVYDYDDGIVSPDRLGTLLLSSIYIDPIKVLPELVSEMHYRSMIVYTAVYDYSN
jgi:hypothetical protein